MAGKEARVGQLILEPRLTDRSQPIAVPFKAALHGGREFQGKVHASHARVDAKFQTVAGAEELQVEVLVLRHVPFGGRVAEGLQVGERFGVATQGHTDKGQIAEHG